MASMSSAAAAAAAAAAADQIPIDPSIHNPNPIDHSIDQSIDHSITQDHSLDQSLDQTVKQEDHDPTTAVQPPDGLSKADRYAFQRASLLNTVNFLKTQGVAGKTSELFRFHKVSRATGYRMLNSAEPPMSYKPLAVGQRDPRGRKQAISADQVQRMVQILDNEGPSGRILSWEQLGKEAGVLNITNRTIARALLPAGYRKCPACHRYYKLSDQTTQCDCVSRNPHDKGTLLCTKDPRVTYKHRRRKTDQQSDEPEEIMQQQQQQLHQQQQQQQQQQLTDPQLTAPQLQDQQFHHPGPLQHVLNHHTAPPAAFEPVHNLAMWNHQAP